MDILQDIPVRMHQGLRYHKAELFENVPLAAEGFCFGHLELLKECKKEENSEINFAKTRATKSNPRTKERRQTKKRGGEQRQRRRRHISAVIEKARKGNDREHVIIRKEINTLPFVALQHYATIKRDVKQARRMVP